MSLVLSSCGIHLMVVGTHVYNRCCYSVVWWLLCVCSSVNSTPMHCFVSHGNLVNTNTMESYRKLDKDQILQDSGKQVTWGARECSAYIEGKAPVLLLVRRVITPKASLCLSVFLFHLLFLS